MTEEKLNLVFEQFVDRSISEADAQALLEYLENHPDEKSDFFQQVGLCNLIVGMGDSRCIADDVVASIQIGESIPDVTEAVINELRLQERNENENEKDGRTAAVPKSLESKKRIAAIGALAMLAAVVVLMGVIFQAEKPGLAVISHLEDAIWIEGTQRQEGDAIQAGVVELKSGIARLDYPNGVRVSLEGPVKYELEETGKTRLYYGKLTANVPPEGVGFRVVTDELDITDLGTTFGVTVEKGGGTEVSVFQGDIAIKSIITGEKSILSEGNRIHRAKGQKTPLKSVKLNAENGRKGWKMLFGVMEISGKIRFIDSNPIVSPRAIVDSENVVIFPEKFGISPAKNTEVTIQRPGIYNRSDFKDRVEFLDVNTKKVNSFLIQYNPEHDPGVGSGGAIQFEGSVTFDHPIAAVIVNRNQLDDTDSTFGLSRFSYQKTPLRGLESKDILTLSSDRLSLDLKWTVNIGLPTSLDQIRVLVEAQ